MTTAAITLRSTMDELEQLTPSERRLVSDWLDLIIGLQRRLNIARRRSVGAWDPAEESDDRGDQPVVGESGEICARNADIAVAATSSHT